MRILTILSYLFYLCISLNGNSQTITVQNLDDSGVGSLRDAISNANSGDTIRFNPMLIAQGSDTLVLDTVINIDKDLVIKGLYDDEDTLFLSVSDNQSFFLVDTVESFTLDSLTFISDSIFNANIDCFKVFESGLCIENSSFLGFKKNVLLLYQSSLRFINSKIFTYDYLSMSGGTPQYIWCYTDGNILRNFEIVSSEIQAGNSNGLYMTLGGVQDSNSVLIKDTYLSNFRSWLFGHFNLKILNSTLENSYINIGHPNISGGSLERNAFISANASTFSLTDFEDLQNPISCIGSPTNPFDPPPLDVFELQFDNCTFNGATYDSSSYEDYFGPDLDELKITSCIFNDINGFNELPIDSSGGYNLFSFPQSIGLDSTDQADISVSDINLEPLQNNGGFTPTHVPNYESLAFNSGNPNDTSSAQNGAIIQRRDIGAAEIQAVLTVDTTEYCGEFYDWRNETLTESNIHFDVQESTTGGYDSVFVLDLTLDYIDAIAISDGGELKANISDASYQWIDCSTNQPLFGETNQVLTPNTEGTYAVIVSSSICTDTSSCVYINNIGLEEQEKRFVFVKDKILYLNNVNSYTEYSVYNNLGQIVFKFNTVKKQQDITHLNSGVYFIEFKDENIQPVKFILD